MVKVESTSPSEESESLPETLIYISCGWQSFKEVIFKHRCDLWWQQICASIILVLGKVLCTSFTLLIEIIVFWQDCKSLLAGKAWHLHKAHGFNFFPGTQRYRIPVIYYLECYLFVSPMYIVCKTLLACNVIVVWFYLESLHELLTFVRNK